MMNFETEACLDDRFNIDQANLSYLSSLRIRDYTIAKIRLGDILRDYEDGLYGLNRAIPYLFLRDPDNPSVRGAYTRYCSKDRNKIGTDERNPEAFLALAKTFRDEGYDIRRSAIVVDQFNIILEGQHRCCIMLHLFGPDHVIDVVRVKRLLKNPRTYFRLALRRFCKR